MTGNTFCLCLQQRFDEMEIKINDLRDQIETIKAEKIRLEKQIQVESEVNHFYFLCKNIFSQLIMKIK